MTEHKNTNYLSPPRANFSKIGVATPGEILENKMLPSCFSPCPQIQYNRPGYIPSSQIFSPFTPMDRNILSPFLGTPDQICSKRILFSPSQYLKIK